MADDTTGSPVSALLSGSSSVPDYQAAAQANIWQDLTTGQHQPLVQQLSAFQPVQPSAPVMFRAAQQAAMHGGQGSMPQGNLSPAEQWIIQHESGGNVNARNPSSGAFGLGQLNPSSGTLQGIAKQLGFNPYTTDYNQQLEMFRTYVAQRYGNAQNAEAFWQAHGWY